MSSDPFPYIATIKHTYTGPTGTNIYAETPKGCNGPHYTNLMDIAGNIVPVQYEWITKNSHRTWSGTFGDGNVVMPKYEECNIIPITKAPSTQDCLEKRGQTSSPLLSQSGTSGMCSSLRPQSPSALFEPFQDGSK